MILYIFASLHKLFQRICDCRKHY